MEVTQHADRNRPVFDPLKNAVGNALVCPDLRDLRRLGPRLSHARLKDICKRAVGAFEGGGVDRFTRERGGDKETGIGECGASLVEPSQSFRSGCDIRPGGWF